MSATEVFAADLVAQHKDDIIRHKKMRHAGQYSDNLNTGDSTPLHNLVAPHIDSFNWIFEPGGGIAQAVQTLPTMRISAVPEGSTGVAGPASDVEFRVSAISVGKPTWTRGSEDSRMLPADSRQLGVTYDAPLNLTLQYRIGGANAAWTEMSRPSGRLPIMVRSSRCHLAGASRAEMVRAKEEAGEWGGYFIINGNERCVRLLIMPRRNHITTLIRSSFLSRGAEYTKFATSIRCVRRDHTAITISAHYLETGGVNVRFTARKQEFFVPAVLILKALTGATDREIFEKITFNDPTLAFENERTELMLRESKALGLRSQSEVLAYLGSHFRNLLRADRDVSDAAVGLQLLREYLFIHVQDFDAAATEEAVNQAKFDLLVLMIQRVLALVQDKITPDHVDALSSHEVLLPGHLYYLILKENVQDMLLALRSNITREFRLAPGRVALTDPNWWRKMSDRIPEIGRKLSYFITTGNLVSRSGLDLMQVSGYTIVAEKLNYYRYLSHFRSIHRGQFFTTMKTTAVRKLLPESWGFVCPIHTPDGSPCGLLNHLTAVCQILTHSSSIPAKDTVAALFALGLRDTFLPARASDIPVMLDGVLVGRVPQLEAGAFSARVRFLKVTNHPAFYKHLEIFTVTDFSDKMFPAVCLSTTASRFQRPVYYLPTGAVPKPVVEYIGAMEQLMMEIAVTPADFRLGQTTHQEINAASMLSVVASLTPFSDHNQSPRNMYQCQMGKQTMGTPFHSFPYRVDNKVFRIQNVQTPIVRNEGPYQKYLFDEYPMGCNAVVAVISYTGYDMEDAMIINKSAYERGFGHGSVYKYKTYDLTEDRIRGEPIHHRFNNLKPGSNPRAPVAGNPALDADGLPRVGQLVHPGEPLTMVHNDLTNTSRCEKFKDTEPAYVEEVRALASSDGELQKVGLWLRMNRNPVIGDKFSSRHGQKGVLSILFPSVDMPWTESGLTPDVIINPHAFPSRMTIGMLIESMAGKAGAVHGTFQDGTPFQFDEQNRAADYFGQQLRSSGYNYLGSEPLYSGITGEPLMADIFVGVVYYQRLRHMVKDKFQARATGPVSSIHRQPVKGRKRHGGIRFGEMERDSLIAHGVSYFLHDRLMNSSDYHTTYVCQDCGSLLAAHAVPPSAAEAKQQGAESLEGSPEEAAATGSSNAASNVTCRLCNSGAGCSIVAIPFSFLYLAHELAAMNIRVTLDIK